MRAEGVGWFTPRFRPACWRHWRPRPRTPRRAQRPQRPVGQARGSERNRSHVAPRLAAVARCPPTAPASGAQRALDDRSVACQKHEPLGVGKQDSFVTNLCQLVHVCRPGVPLFGLRRGALPRRWRVRWQTLLGRGGRRGVTSAYVSGWGCQAPRRRSLRPRSTRRWRPCAAVDSWRRRLRCLPGFHLRRQPPPRAGVGVTVFEALERLVLEVGEHDPG